MNIVTLDYETEFSDTYTLKRGKHQHTTEHYVRSEKFETVGVSLRHPDGRLVWHGGTREQIAPALHAVDWSRTAVLCHHANFDCFILSHHFGIRPYAILDTLSMARLLLGNHLGLSLDELACHFNLRGKTIDYELFRGKHWAELDAGTQVALSGDFMHDAALTFQIFEILAKDFPPEEYAIVDMTVRLFTEPTLIGDINALGQVWTDEANKKKALLATLGVEAAELQSAATFVALLSAEGVDVPTKEGKAGPIPCVAKTDQFMKDLLESENDRIRTLAEARLGVRSTIDQTRAERLGWMARRGPLPVYLSYAGAHTTRWSGGDKVNWQNFKRGGGIRGAITVPQDLRIIKADKSQVECRFLNYLAGQMDVIEKFRNKEDPYIGIASKAYGEPVYKAKKDDPRFDEMEAKRGTGKQLELSCLGPDTLVLTNHGPKAITTIRLDDWLWDGVEWVTHQGLLHRGVRSVMTVAGLSLTPDHLVLCGSTWRSAAQLQNAGWLSQALERGSENLPFPGTRSGVVVACLGLWSHAHVAPQNTRLTRTTWPRVQQHAATLALKKLLGTGQKSTTGTQIFALTTRIVADCSIALLRFLHAVILNWHTNTSIGTMRDAVSACTLPSKTDEPFSLMLSHYQDGLTQIWSWIVETLTGTTSQAISALSHTNETRRTGGRLPNLSRLSPTYDIACSGPRNRFTIVTDAGPIIVHNCGFGSGAQTIVDTAAKGTYGPPVKIDLNTGYAWRDLYRDGHLHVVSFWDNAEWAFRRMAEGVAFSWSVFHFKDGRVFGPGGTMLHYPDLHYEQALEDDAGTPLQPSWSYRVARGGKGIYKLRGQFWKRLWGSAFTENLIQWVSCIDVKQSLLRIKRRAPAARLVNLEHDAAIYVEKLDRVDETAQIVEEEFSRAPTWLPDLPLACEVSIGDRYG